MPNAVLLPIPNAVSAGALGFGEAVLYAADGPGKFVDGTLRIHWHRFFYMGSFQPLMCFVYTFPIEIVNAKGG